MFPVVENSRLLGCITTREVKKVPQDQWSDRTVGELTSPCSADNTVSPETDATQVLSLMTQPNASSRFMVVEDQRLIGIISFTDLKEFLSLKLELESSNR
ncbi:MAG: CBS domain-containing protein [Halobacteria archaeon]|nr:CBS domain-containing protein [Halobacteria archaeon]